MATAKELKRFLSKAKLRNDGCWEWTGYKNSDSQGKEHGRIRINGELKLAHRVIYEWFHRKSLTKLCLHLCHNAWCVNPLHLYEGTHKDNTRDRDVIGRTVLPDNTGIKNGGAKLTPELVLEMREEWATGEYKSHAALAEVFDISRKQAGNIVNRKSWSHLS